MRHVSHHLFLLAAAATAWLPLPLHAQGSDSGSAELPPILPVGREIALARSAAPAEISAKATVLVLVRGKGYEVAEEGSNGVTCLVTRSWPEAIEPYCLDAEASRSILQVELRKAELKEKGWRRDAIQVDIAEGFRTGRLAPPSRLAMTWMMSADQVLFNDAGERVGAWKPHVMIFYPYLSEADVGLDGEPPENGPMVVDPGRPTSNVILVMPSFVQPDFGKGG